LEHHANIHAQNELPLRLANEHNHENIVRYLIQNGANIEGINIRFAQFFNLTSKPDYIPKFHECPISRIDFSENTQKIGCIMCLNVFSKDCLENCLKVNYSCPMCRDGKTFYLA